MTYIAANSTSTINDVEPGLLGFLVVAALGLALVFLLRSMNKQFRKIGPRPEQLEETDVAAADEAHSTDQAYSSDEAERGVAGTTAEPASDDGGAPRP